VILITAALTVFSILRTPSFQVVAGRLAAGFLSKKLNTEVYLDRLRLTESLHLQLNGLQVNDHHRNVMLKVDELRLKADFFSIKNRLFRFDRVMLDSGKFMLQKYPEENLLNLEVFLQGLQPDSIPEADTLPYRPWSFYCKELLMNDFTFGLRQGTPETHAEGIDFNDLFLSGIFIDLKEIAVVGDSVAAFVDHISCKERSGLELLHFSGDARVSSSGIRLDQGQVSTGQTGLDLDLELLYDDYPDLSWFLDSVRINANLRSSLVTLSDIGYFAPEMFKMDDPVMISGLITGSVSDFMARELFLKTGEFTEFRGDFGMKGLPDFNNTFIIANIEEFITTPEDLASFNLPMEPSNLELPAQLKKLGFTSVKGDFTGFPLAFNTGLTIRSDAGTLKIKGSMSDRAIPGKFVFEGDVTGDQILLGDLLEIEDLGTVNFEFELDGNGKALEELDLLVNGWIEHFEFRGYSYDKIILGGAVSGKSFDGRLVVLDDMLNLGFTGLVDFNQDQPVFDFTLDIEEARLYALNLSDRSPDANLVAMIRGDLTGIQADSVYGNLSLTGLCYTENKVDYRLNKLDVMRQRIPGQPDRLKLRSDFVDGDIEGKFLLVDLVTQFTDFLLGNDKNPEVKNEMETNPQFISFDLKLKDLTPVTELFLPGIHVAPGTYFTGYFSSEKREFNLQGATEEIIVSGIKIRDITFSGLTVLDEFNLDITAGDLLLRENEDGSGMGLDNLATHFVFGDSTVTFAFQWDNNSPDAPNNGALDGFLYYKSPGSFEAALDEAEANINGNLWHIEKGNRFIKDSTSLTINNFRVVKGEESFVVNGALSNNVRDTLTFAFDDWELGNFNPVLENFSLVSEGTINGKLGLFRHNDLINLFAGIDIADFTLNEVYFGDADFKTRWIDSEKALAIDLNISSKGTMDTPYRILGVNGIYYPFESNRNFDLDISAQNLNISVLKPLLSSFSSHLSGFATGKLTLDGTNKEPVLLGSLKLQRAEMQIDYLNVIYSFSNVVEFKKDLIGFSQLKVYDPNSNTALLSGGIRHKYFQDMSLDLTLEPANFMAINLNRYQNEVFYGTAYATGTVRLFGPFDNLTIKVDARTDKNTQVYIPINYSVDVSQNNFIVFTNIDDSVKEEKSEEVRVVGVSLDIGMNVTRDADIEIFLPGNLGSLKAKGDGDLRLGVDPNGYLTLVGSYIIQSGLFVFSLEQLVSRRFDIMEGSKISWTGDIVDAEVSIVARYRLRTDLSGLGITLIDPDAASQKVIVFTDIRMKGNLFNPELSFGISFPNMQEQTRQAVYAVLDTNDLGQMNQQAISLLVLGSFSSTGSGGTNPVNPAAIVSNTLSNMLSQISNDFNIGINYVPGDQVSAEQLEVALSTQLLDDRLIIDGNIDMTGSNASSQKTSSIVGDINVEYKLTPDGRFRVKAFNRSNDLSLFNDYAPYTQGVGIFYRKDFDNIHELFRKPGYKPKEKNKSN